SVVDIHSGLPVLELGPGTGAITKSILGRGVRPENLVAIEYSTDFHKHQQRNARDDGIEGEAAEIDKSGLKIEGIAVDEVHAGIGPLQM
ncbi:SAM-dependent methyltransferase, partial [Rhizobium leguminosarum]